MNIILSGWPATGTSSIAMVLSYVLKYKYLYAGGLVKYLAELVQHDTDGDGLVRFEQVLGEPWDNLWEKYREWKLSTSENILLDAKTAGFLQKDKSKTYSIMLTASLARRTERAKRDRRHENETELAHRDTELKLRWQKLFGIDIYSAVEINQNYNLHIDTSDFEMEQTLETIFNALSVHPYFSQHYFFPDLVKQIDVLADNFNKYGKDFYYQALAKSGLMVSYTEILREFNLHFSPEAERLDPEVKKHIKSSSN